MSDTTEEIKRRLDIHELVQEYVPLKRAGTNWKGLCPFHQEKTPSFMVSPDRQMWHCFGCAKGGDAFSFLQEIEGIDFSEALRLLAQRTNVPLPQFNREEKSERSGLAELVRDAARFFYAELRGTKGRGALAYLRERGLSDKTMQQWKLGYAPDSWDALLMHLQQKGYRIPEIVKSGIALEREGKNGVYDRFRNRIMFPLSDVHGTIVGFTGRALAENEGAKYINTPTTALYDKSRLVYGLDLAKNAIKREGKVVLVEGQMDVISSHQAGVENAVGVSGTALTVEQIQLIKRFAHVFVLSFDEDPAGSAAALRGIELCWKEEITLEMLVLPKGKDPDACVKEDPALWRKAIHEARPFLEHLFDRVQQMYDSATIHGRKETSRFLLPLIARLYDPVERSLWFTRLGELVGVPEQVLHEAIGKKNRFPTARPSAPISKSPASPRKEATLVSTRLLALIGAHPEVTRIVGTSLDPAFFEKPQDALAQIVREQYTLKDLTQDAFFQHIQEIDPSLAREIYFLKDDFANIPPQDVEREAQRLLSHIRRAHYTGKLQAITRHLRAAEDAGNQEEVAKLLEQCQKIMSELHS